MADLARRAVVSGAAMRGEPSLHSPQANLDDDPGLLEIRKRFSGSTYNAARLLRRTGHPRFIPAVVCGILERYAESRPALELRSAGDGLRLAEDLGLDSLTLTDVGIALEDAAGFELQPVE